MFSLMFWSAMRLLGQAWSYEVGVMGTSTTAIICVVIALVVIEGNRLLFRGGFSAMKEHWRGDALLTVAVTIACWGTLFLWSLAHCIYTDNINLRDIAQKRLVEVQGEDGHGGLKGRISELTGEATSLSADNERLKNENAELKKELVPSAPPARDPDGIYQFGELVASAEGGITDQGHVQFPVIQGNAKFDFSSTMEWRQYLIGNCTSGVTGEIGGFGMPTIRSYRQPTCQILGQRH